MIRRLAVPIVAALAAGAAAAAFGQAPPPQPQTQGAVTYLTGGAGDEEVQRIRQAMKEYPVALAFARAGSPRAEYVAEVAVTIRDAKGATVFDAPSVGPYLLVKLPPGRYTVQATYGGRAQARTVTAGSAGGSLVTVEWP